LVGLGAMVRVSQFEGIVLMRPLLDVPKVRLVATLDAIGVSHADDPSNRDPRFTRARLRAIMPRLAEEGLDARRLAQLATRLRRASAAVEAAVDQAARDAGAPWDAQGPIALELEKFARLPAEIALRLLGRAIAQVGNEGAVELAKLEALYDLMQSGTGTRKARLRRTLAGAVVTLSGGRLVVELAPPRRKKKTV